MTNEEMERCERLHPDLDEEVAGWREGHPDGSLEAAVRDLRLWKNPWDENAQWLVWQALKRAGDPAALKGFEAMRAAAGKAVAAGPYDPLPDLIEYFVSSRRAVTKASAHAQGQIMARLGITPDADRSEAAERVRQAVEQARERAR